MIEGFGLGSGHIKLAKNFLASRNDNPDYLEALDDFSGLLLSLLKDNMEKFL